MEGRTAPAELLADVVAPVAIKAARYAEVRNPANFDEVVGAYALCTAAEVNRITAIAGAATDAWRSFTATERADHLRRAASALEPERDALADLLTREQGKVLWESQLDIAGGIRLLRHYADMAEEIDREEVVTDDRGTTIVRRMGMGPTALIVPWNYPVYLCVMGLAPALMAGNPVVVKPSEFAPLALTRVLRHIAEQLPPGVLNVVPGTGGEAGAALVAAPEIRKVLFTGGAESGRSVLRGASDRFKSVSLELGGNDPALVLESASLDDTTMREIRRAVFACSGQVCFNIKRIYVHQSKYSEFVDKFSSAVDEIVVGDGTDTRSTIGPLNNEKQYRSVGQLIEQTARSSVVKTLGTKADADTWDRGYFTLPSVVTGASQDSPIVQGEQFGPLVPVLSFADEDEAVRLANDTEFGLAASVWTADPAHGLDLARRVEAGSVFVNSHRVGSSDQTMPFGGMKQSGLGRNHGMWAIEECSELQAISHRPDTSAFPGAPP